MDELNKFLIDCFPTNAEKTASVIALVEPTALEKRAFSVVGHACESDDSFLSQFEGTPLLPQAIALAEQELALEQRQLQQRAQQEAQRQTMDTWAKDDMDRSGLRLQKQQLILALFKSKATTPAPMPGDAVIGSPDPALAAQPPMPGAPVEGGMGADGGAPVEEVGAPPSKLASLIEAAAKKGWAHTVPAITQFGRNVGPAKIAKVTDDEAQHGPELLPFGSTYVGMQRGAMSGRPIEGALRGAAGGTVGATLGALPGHTLMNLSQQHGSKAGILAGLAGGVAGSIYGGAKGTHLATRTLIPEDQQKQASIKLFAKRLRQA